MGDVCECCHAPDWLCCRCDVDCETGRRRIAEGRDPTDVEGDPLPAPSLSDAPEGGHNSNEKET